MPNARFTSTGAHILGPVSGGVVNLAVPSLELGDELSTSSPPRRRRLLPLESIGRRPPLGSSGARDSCTNPRESLKLDRFESIIHAAVVPRMSPLISGESRHGDSQLASTPTGRSRGV